MAHLIVFFNYCIMAGMRRSILVIGTFVLSIYVYGEDVAGVLSMPEMPPLLAVPSVSSIDEPMAGRKVFMDRVWKTATSGNHREYQNGHTPSSSSVMSPLPPSSPSIANDDARGAADREALDTLHKTLSAKVGDTSAKSEEATAKVESVSVERSNATNTILRFMVNGNDVRAMCRNVHISDMEKDGSFLLTGQRRYWVGNSGKIEAFYMMFKANESEEGRYDVRCSVTQDEINPASFLYRLSMEMGLCATRCGNLVALRDNGKDITADLLLDIGGVHLYEGQ